MLEFHFYLFLKIFFISLSKINNQKQITKKTKLHFLTIFIASKAQLSCLHRKKNTMMVVLLKQHLHR